MMIILFVTGLILACNQVVRASWKWSWWRRAPTLPPPAGAPTVDIQLFADDSEIMRGRGTL